ncbi:type II secretion system protein GspK [Planctomycetota bacterium]
MNNKTGKIITATQNKPGIVLLLTLVLLVVLSTLGYTLSSRVAAQRHRNQYIIDYSKARYSCDSAVKYALATLEDINPILISRPNEPDFSDLYAITEQQYQDLLAQWGIAPLLSASGISDINDESDSNNISQNDLDFFTADTTMIPGPYGPVWPLITEPVEFEIDSAQIRIEIEDENAKYPLGWAIMNNEEMQREIDAGFYTFCEMMGIDDEQIESLREQLAQIAEVKKFTMNIRPIVTTVRTPITPASPGPSTRTSTNPINRISRETISVQEQAKQQYIHFAKIFHSSLLDTEALAKPIIDAGSRKESALKYLGTWGSMKVNINTAPRHVLEAAFIFGGDQVQIAEEIIQQRRLEPFSNIENLNERLLGYSDTINNSKQYITTESTFFTIKITAVSGVAKASSVIAISKNGDKITRIAVING